MHTGLCAAERALGGIRPSERRADRTPHSAGTESGGPDQTVLFQWQPGHRVAQRWVEAALYGEALRWVEAALCGEAPRWDEAERTSVRAAAAIALGAVLVGIGRGVAVLVGFIVSIGR